jgi:hypothetical protein
MDRADVKELHFITYISNIPSIQSAGILSRNEMKRKEMRFKDISEQGVQERRANKKIPGTSKYLHDYANLYFDAHNPMLSRRRSENDEICVLRIDRDVSALQGVIVTDKNAARECWFKPVDEGLPLLDRNEIYMVNWKDPDDWINEYRRAGIKCAEILVPERVESRYIIGAYAASRTGLDAFQKVCGLPVEINTDLFFYGGY